MTPMTLKPHNPNNISYEEMQAMVYSEALTEAFLDYGEDHEFDAMASAQETVYEWTNKFPENGNDWQDQ